MYHARPGIKDDAEKRWALPDRAFFAHGACHILAGVFLRTAPRPGFRAERIVPNGTYPGNHIYVTDGHVAFDYRGYVARDRLLAWFRQGWGTRVPGWSGTLEAVRFDLLDTGALNARKMRGPDQYLHDPIPRARAFLATKRHG
ncbi:hypothetical protein ACERZ8_17735 [Tateyamaria armeniaca]|uniref:Uncharacterized protein n=1 Tax=Tateyamaria armeniaca TaxID=2518930 RepID=A0ABW8V135_9RHOB